MQSTGIEARLREVSKNRGSSGIDAITVEDYKANLEQEIRELSAELKDWSYKPRPVRRMKNSRTGTAKSPGMPGGLKSFSVNCSLTVSRSRETYGPVE